MKGAKNMMLIWTIVAVVAVAVIIGVVIYFKPMNLSSQTGYIDLTPIEAKETIDIVTDLIIIDVSPAYDAGHLPGAVSYPLGDGTLDNVIPTLDKTKPYLIYCHTSSASISAAQKLVNAGFETVYRLKGEYGAWVSAGYPIE